MSSIMSQTEKDVKSFEGLFSSCCNKLCCKAFNLSCGHRLCDRCFWKTVKETTIRDCTSIKCKQCGALNETNQTLNNLNTDLVNLQCANKYQYFTECETHISQLKKYFCSDHLEALCTDCVSEHKLQNCHTEPIENKIKEEMKTAGSIFSDDRFKNVAECLCSVEDTEMMLDVFYFKLKKRFQDYKERFARELGISIQYQELIKQVHDDIQRVDHMVSQNIFTHNTLDELLMTTNACNLMMSNLKLSEHAEIFVAKKSKDFELVLGYDGDPIQLSLTDWSVYQSSSCVEDEKTQPCEPSDSVALHSDALGERDGCDSNNCHWYDSSFDASDDDNVDGDDDNDNKEEEVIEDIEDVTIDATANEYHYSLTKEHDVSLPNQALAKRSKLQSNRTPRKDGGLLKSTDYRRKQESSWDSNSDGILTDKLKSNRDFNSATNISKSTDDRENDASSLIKVKTMSDILCATDRGKETSYRRSTSEGNDAATVSYKAGSSKFSESKSQDWITSDLTTNRMINTDSPANSLHSSVQSKPQGEIQHATETPNVPISTPSSNTSIPGVDTNMVNRNRTLSFSEHSTVPTIQQHTLPITFAPGMEIRSQLPHIKEDFTVRECIGIVILDRFILTNNGKILQKRRFDNSKLIEDTELSNMTSLCLVPFSCEISVLQTNKFISVYSADSSKWHLKANITLPYKSFCCWKVEVVEGLDFWKSYVFVASYTNDIRQDCIRMVTFNHYCTFPKSDKMCECTIPRESVLLTSETSPCIRGVSSLDVMRRDQQLFISAIEGLVCAKVLGEEKVEISWTCPFRTNISHIASDSMHVYVCVPNEKRVAKVSKDGQIITSNILPLEIVPDRIAVKENTVLVGSFFHHDWTCKVYRLTF